MVHRLDYGVPSRFIYKRNQNKVKNLWRTIFEKKSAHSRFLKPTPIWLQGEWNFYFKVDHLCDDWGFDVKRVVPRTTNRAHYTLVLLSYKMRINWRPKKGSTWLLYVREFFQRGLMGTKEKPLVC